MASLVQFEMSNSLIVEVSANTVVGYHAESCAPGDRESCTSSRLIHC